MKYTYLTHTTHFLSGMVHTAAAFLLIAVCGASLLGCASEQPLPEQESSQPLPEQTSYEITAEQIDSYEITVPGLSKSYDLLFLTDSHIIIPPSDDSQEIKDYSNERLAAFTAESGLVSSEVFSAWIDYANAETPDILLLGGDIIDSPSDANISYLNQTMEKLQTPFLYTLGNHDWTYPWKYMTEEGKAAYLPLLSFYTDDNPAIHTLELEDLILVAVDNSSNQIHPDALEPYQEILQRGKPVILLLHVPLYTEALFAKTSEAWNSSVTLGGGVHGGIYPNDISAQFMSLTTAADSPVALIVAGHVHLSDQSDVIGEKTIPQITGNALYKEKGTWIRLKG